MNKLNVSLLLFVLVVIAQLFVPAKMILDREDVLQYGKEYKFKIKPIDPNDPFRGKYIILSYEADRFEIKPEENWRSEEDVYVKLTNNEKGFAAIQAVKREKPQNTSDYVKVDVYQYADSKSKYLSINYPFDRYYMEESKALEAELMYNRLLSDATKVSYAVIAVKDGDAVLKDVQINGSSISDLVKLQDEQSR